MLNHPNSIVVSYSKDNQILIGFCDNKRFKQGEKFHKDFIEIASRLGFAVVISPVRADKNFKDEVTGNIIG